MLKTDNEDIKHLMDEIAHQWRQPLAQINSIVFSIDDLMYENNIQNDEIEKKLLQIEHITKHMSNTINDIRYQAISENSTVILDNLFEEVSSLISDRVEDNDIKLFLDVDKSISIESNNRTLLQAIHNITNNSIDILLERNIFNAYIKISAVQTQTEIIISIIDNGGGMTQSMMQKIFDREYTTKHESQGSGVGLYMTKKMIEAHLSAALKVFNVGHGLCFEIRFLKESLSEV